MCPFAKRLFVAFAGGPKRQRLQKKHMAGHLVTGQLRAAVALHRLGRKCSPGLRHDKGRAGLAPFRIGHPYHGRVGHVRVRSEYGFDFSGIDVFAAADVHVFFFRPTT